MLPVAIAVVIAKGIVSIGSALLPKITTGALLKSAAKEGASEILSHVTSEITHSIMESQRTPQGVAELKGLIEKLRDLSRNPQRADSNDAQRLAKDIDSGFAVLEES